MKKEITPLNLWIGNRLKELRLQAGYSKNGFARLLNITRIGLTNMESGTQTINSRDIFNASVLLGISPAEFFPLFGEANEYVPLNAETARKVFEAQLITK